MIRIFAAIVISFFFVLPSFGQDQEYKIYDSPQDSILFEQYIKAMEDKKDLPLPDLLIETALYFLNTPYVASTLEKEPEGLVINLRGMDCTTFVENTITLARTLKGNGKISYKNFCDNLLQLRYRNGEITDYTDRLHYATDWIYENEQKGILKDVSKEIGGVQLPLELSFMSTHPDSYAPLKNNPGRIKHIAGKEEEISKRTYYFIPENKIDNYSGSFRNGDIVCFVTTINGLDVSHMGIIYVENEKVSFIHASSGSAKRVIVEPRSLMCYVSDIRTNKGIIVSRVQN